MSKRKAINTALAAATFQWKGRELVSATIAADKAYDSGRLEGLKEAARLLSKKKREHEAERLNMYLSTGIAFLLFHTKKLGKLLRAPKKED